MSEWEVWWQIINFYYTPFGLHRESAERFSEGDILGGSIYMVLATVPGGKGFKRPVEKAAIKTGIIKQVTKVKNVTYLYQKVSAEGKHLKFGITNNPATRYTKKELAGGRLRIIAQGERSKMLHLERNLHETLPLGTEEGQLYYLKK